MAERRRHRTFLPRFDGEERQRQPLAFLGESPRRRRESLAFCERTLECLQTFARDARLLAQRLPFCTHASIEDATRPSELGA